MGLFSRQSNMTAARSVKIVKDASGASANNLNDIEQTGGVSLRKKTEAVAVSLRKKDLSGVRAQVIVLLDHSGSMYSNYESGKVQELVERFLGFGLAVDVDGEVPVVAFDSRVHNEVDVTMQNYHNVVKDRIYDVNKMGSTDLAGALEVVREEAKVTDTPLYVAVVTDGEPDDRNAARELVKDLSRYPVFIKFLAVAPVRFLEELDDMGDRLLDNVDAKAYSDLNRVTDEQFAADMVDEWDSWQKAALAAGVLTQ